MGGIDNSFVVKYKPIMEIGGFQDTEKIRFLPIMPDYICWRKGQGRTSPLRPEGSGDLLRIHWMGTERGPCGRQNLHCST